MLNLSDLFDPSELHEAIYDGYVRRQQHPSLPLSILNYTAKAQYDRVWNQVTRQCRGLIYDDTGTVVARPFPKFFNTGEHEPVALDITTREPIYAGDFTGLDLTAPVQVTDKMDGSLGILYPDGEGGHAIATRGSFTSDQAVHATELYRSRYAGRWQPDREATYLFEIIFPGNRIVVDYGDLDDLILLDTLSTATGRPVTGSGWLGRQVTRFDYPTLADALVAPPRADAEGLVVFFPDLNERVKIKQDDYVALHRILTGTNARHVWEVAAVKACHGLIQERKHWGSFLGIDPARAEQVLELGDDWLAGVPDEFYTWIHEVIETAQNAVASDMIAAGHLAVQAAAITDRKDRYRFLAGADLRYLTEVMRVASAPTADDAIEKLDSLYLKCWRVNMPEPSMPFARSEDVA